MKVLLTGANGQLGYELQKTCPKNIALICTDYDTLDITNAQQIDNAIAQHQPDCIINAAAYTAVDKAENDKDAAWALNAAAPGLLAKACTQHAIKFIQISTDFVFDGQQSTPYLPEATCTPLGEYGKSKLAGEQAALEHAPTALIVRTSWLYSARGNNFVKSMIRLMNERDELGIVYDQAGSPTWADTLARCIWSLIEQNARGIIHCTDNGVVSWYDFAIAIQEEAQQRGLIAKPANIKPIRSAEYPTPAQRPAYSVMDKQATEHYLGQSLPYWRTSLRSMLDELNEHISDA
jgi:dTDP-4-dehydrorhamnose reductase